MFHRRTFLATAAAALATAGRGRAEEFEITLSPAEWRARLTPAQFAVLREEATERAYSNSLMGESSDLLNESRAGTYHCAGCDLPVYDSETKYDSGTGWPSFTEAIAGNVGTKKDRKLIFVRTEVHCARCGGPLGHVFDDGPPPTGKRHCINALAMTFTPA